MDANRRRELLRGSPYFEQLEPLMIERIISRMESREHRPGARIFTEGSEAGSAALHFVDSGLVKIYKLSAEGREQVLRLFRPGDSFADVPAFDGGPYPASADAVEHSTVIVLPRRALLEIMSAHPEIALGAVRVMAGRLRHMTDLVEDLSLRRVMARVARLLLENQGNANLTQSQMAAMVGTAREMVNRSLHTLADRGVIELRGASIVVVDEVALARIVAAG
jgi:CRP/FNR family transcriptional regulator